MKKSKHFWHYRLENILIQELSHCHHAVVKFDNQREQNDELSDHKAFNQHVVE